MSGGVRGFTGVSLGWGFPGARLLRARRDGAATLHAGLQEVSHSHDFLLPASAMWCSWGGSRPVRLDDGSQRTFLLDGDTGGAAGRRAVWHCGMGTMVAGAQALDGWPPSRTSYLRLLS